LTPDLTINSSDVTHAGTYVVTVSSLLYAQVPVVSFDFEVYMTPCEITPVVGLGKLEIGIGN
jgi:hypothetical protein